MGEDSESQTSERSIAAFRAFLDGRDDVAEGLCISVLDEALSTSQGDIRVVECLHTLARICISSERLAEAESYFLRGLEVCEKLQPAEEFTASVLMGQLGELYRWQGKYERAEQLVADAVALCERSMGVGNQFLREPLTYYVSLLEETGRAEEAREIKARLAELSSLFPADGEI